MPVLAGAFRNDIGRNRRTRNAQTQEECLVDLLAIDAERQSSAEFEICEPFLDFGIEAIGEVEFQFGIGAVEPWIEMNFVVPARGVLQEHRQFCEIDEPLHVVVLAGDRPQIDDLRIFGKRELNLVEIGQLVALRVSGPERGITLKTPDWSVETCAELWKPGALGFSLRLSTELYFGRNCLR